MVERAVPRPAEPGPPKGAGPGNGDVKVAAWSFLSGDREDKMGIDAVLSGTLALITLILAIATLKMARSIEREFRANRLPILRLDWGSVSHCNSRLGHYAATVARVKPATSIPIIVHRVGVHVARGSDASRAHPHDGWNSPPLPCELRTPTDTLEIGIKIPLDDPSDRAEPAPQEPARFMMRINVEVSTPAVDRSREQWTSLTALTRSIEPYDFEPWVTEHFHRWQGGYVRKWCDYVERIRREMGG